MRIINRVVQAAAFFAFHCLTRNQISDVNHVAQMCIRDSYRTGSIDDVNATVYLREGTKGNILTIKDMGTFQEPKYYYRPVPKHEMDLNPNLGPQLFGWE